MKRWVSWGVGAALVAVAWGVAAITPTEDSSEDPFPVTVAVGERGEGRNIAITVDDIRRAETVRADEWSATGNWVVVDLDAEAVVSESGTLLTVATLEVDGRTFGASERPDSLLKAALSVDIPQSGSVAFELPAELHGGDGILTFGLRADPRLDSLIVLDVDLDAIDVEDEAELRVTGWSTR